MPGSSIQELVVSDYARRLIRFKARQLCRRPSFSCSDQEDLEQELWTHLFVQAPAFDPTRASIDTFVDRVVCSGARMILRERRRGKRSEGFLAQSTDACSSASSPEGDPAPLEIDTESRGRHRGTYSVSELLRAEDRESVEHAIREMPEAIREVCQRVMAGTERSAARDLGVSRRQVRNLLEVARSYLEQAGFGKT